jgi:hypothetical protein
MRSRNIKPGLYKNETLAECSIWARYLFPGLWMMADRSGRMEDRPKRIKGELLPFDSVEIEPLLQELHSHKHIIRYEIDGVKYIQIPGFESHQSPHFSEKESLIPQPLTEDSRKIPSSSDEIPKVLAEKAPLKTGSQLPDSLIPDSLIPERETVSPKHSRKKPKLQLAEWEAQHGAIKLEDFREFAETRSIDPSQLPEMIRIFRTKCEAQAYTYADFRKAFQSWDWSKSIQNFKKQAVPWMERPENRMPSPAGG